MNELERNTLVYLCRYGLFLKFSQSDQWFNNIVISTFLHSTAVDLPSSYSDRYLKGSAGLLKATCTFSVNKLSKIFEIENYVIYLIYFQDLNNTACLD